MLDTSTKKRIDDCRDILVGKLPDPKAQIEQITIGLIYKFMDDMDKEAIELGGKAKFFSGNFEKFSWDNLFDTRVTAIEMLGLYSEAIVSMDKNPNIPQLFRDIFKNAYLPYRDPETLKMFLKTISEFEYTHSEKLGDAFEYLLSVMGSQGDAGQFRTPRHIIDFLVAAVNPGKNDTILDPACGTAGFLISAFKYVMNGDATPDERKRIIKNFVGYDISPDMVRLSLVNLYLHGFSDPHISEYDTLSSEDRWKDNFDVILANPPFMSPKGGIRPHKKFSISSNRSEVLFVDYIAEHLNPKGRAGIIVPEGIIFQSGTAYKELRKMLVENYLYAVVSLPAGVFNPYSGVKTSILLMDKEFAKTSNEILFVKVANDGYGLGAQRNAVKGGQLDDAIDIIQTFVGMRKGVDKGNVVETRNCSSPDNTISHIVQKSEIAKNGDYNLSGERYKQSEINNSVYPLINLGTICSILDGKRIPITSSNRNEGVYPYYGASGIVDYVADFIFDEDLLLVSEDGANLIARVTPIAFSVSGKVWVNNHAHVLKFESDATRKYVEYVLNSMSLEPYITGSAQPKLNQKALNSIQIPLPPLPIQQQIVSEIESYQKIIDGAKMVVENYKPKIDIEEEWEMVELGSFCSIKHGFAFKSEDFNTDGNNQLPIVLAPGNFSEDGGLYFTEKNTRRYSGNVEKEYLFNTGDLVIVMTDLSPMMRILGNPAIIESIDILHNQRIGKFIFKNELVAPKYLYYSLFLPNVKNKIKQTATGTLIRHTSPSRILECEIPVPQKKIQHQIVTQIEKEQELVKSTKRLIKIFEQKIKDRIAKVWGE